jgi:NADH oxidase (H2O2-forming)
MWFTYDTVLIQYKHSIIKEEKMKQADVVVIGGSAAGIPAAITCRRHYPEKKVMLIRKEKQVQIPCGIPYIYGTVNSPDNNVIPDGVLANNNIELCIAEATAIDRKNKHIKTAGGENIAYDKLILATGSIPMILPIPGIDKKNVFTIKKDGAYLKELLNQVNKAKNIVILGGGFIGVEFADECKKNRDANVAIVELLPHCLMLAFEEEFCQEVEQTLKNRGIQLITGVKLEEVLGDTKVTGVKLSDGREIKADLLIVAIGVTPNTVLAKAAGLKIDRGGIVVDPTMKTSDEHIFACGDCTSKRSFFTGHPVGCKLASIATMEARIAGANLYGKRRECPGVVGVFATAIGGIALGMAGLSEKIAQENGYEILVGEAEAVNRHPGGMPGATNMKVKLIFNKKTGELLGGQVRGGDSAGELTNTISACIQKKMTADDIATFQLGTHPAVTASPIAYQLVNAAEMSIKNMR